MFDSQSAILLSRSVKSTRRKYSDRKLSEPNANMTLIFFFFLFTSKHRFLSINDFDIILFVVEQLW